MHSDYFEFMGVPRRMNLDAGLLEKAYYALSRKFHPDFFHAKSEKEKFWSRVQTATLNKAYQILRDPIERARYILDLELPARREERTKIDPALASEIFEIQELVEEQRRARNPALKAKLDKAKKELEDKVAVKRRVFQEHFKVWDDEEEPSKRVDLARFLRTLIDEIAYLKNLLQSIESGGQIRQQ
ncbi:MAG: Fe-S protein assembly co-chaperone HscB [Candidatus Omnitrophota bacterium]